ncbi:hypothetical protein BDV93DRAFT_573730 [Ceratobasidium sp. AG-I]|nr:hypothetical protein BDV93DRAFT_573730 [Ceratobasidium sp. AG-I]
MLRISSFLPLPGVSELQNLAEGFSRRLKDADLAYLTRAALSRRLEALKDLASEQGNIPDLNAQLREVEQEFQLIEASSSRLGSLHVVRRREAWENLQAKLNAVVEMSSLQLLAQVSNAQVEQMGAQMLEGYEITSQVEIHEKTRNLPDLVDRRRTDIRTSLRVGQFGNLSVVYKTFVADSKPVAHYIVEGEMQHISQSLHFNVATLVGATKGYNGLNGIIVTMDGLDFAHFALKTHSGAVWAKCITGIEAFLKSGPTLKRAQRITVACSGHVTVFPSTLTRKSFQGMVVEFKVQRGLNVDPSATLISDIYAWNYAQLGPQHLDSFVNSLTRLKLGFPEFQVMKIASSCKLLPLPRNHFCVPGNNLPSFQPEAGGFGYITQRRGKLFRWEPLGFSHRVQRRDLDYSARTGALELEWCNTSMPEGAHWLTFILHKPPLDRSSKNETTYTWCYKRELRALSQSLWADILTEAHELSERLQIDIDSITFYYRTLSIIKLLRPKDANWEELPNTFYYHWPLSSSGPRQSVGFLSTSRIPSDDGWHKQLKQRGWKPSFRMKIMTLDMRDDWGRQYEREIVASMEAMPGSYLGTRIEEVS